VKKRLIDCNIWIELPFMSSEKQWVSVHICPKCGHRVNLAEIDLNAITTGILPCPRCDWSEAIQIQIVEASTLLK
jgi:hypothetical protein